MPADSLALASCHDEPQHGARGARGSSSSLIGHDANHCRDFLYSRPAAAAGAAEVDVGCTDASERNEERKGECGDCQEYRLVRPKYPIRPMRAAATRFGPNPAKMPALKKLTPSRPLRLA